MEIKVKTHTDLKQSELLGLILDEKTADSYYVRHNDCYHIIHTNCQHPCSSKEKTPCWSLAALLSLFDSYQISRDKESGLLLVTVQKEGKVYSTNGTDNEVDACFLLLMKMKMRDVADFLQFMKTNF